LIAAGMDGHRNWRPPAPAAAPTDVSVATDPSRRYGDVGEVSVGDALGIADRRGLLKLVLLRYGGKCLHDAGKDVAIGWVLGHVAVMVFWYLFDFATGTSTRPSGLESG